MVVGFDVEKCKNSDEGSQQGFSLPKRGLGVLLNENAKRKAPSFWRWGSLVKSVNSTDLSRRVRICLTIS